MSGLPQGKGDMSEYPASLAEFERRALLGGLGGGAGSPIRLEGDSWGEVGRWYRELENHIAQDPGALFAEQYDDLCRSVVDTFIALGHAPERSGSVAIVH